MRKLILIRDMGTLLAIYLALLIIMMLGTFSWCVSFAWRRESRQLFLDDKFGFYWLR